MQNLTLENIYEILIFIIGLATAIITITKALKKVLEKELSPINNTIKELDTNQCKNYLVRFLADVERGVDLDDVEIKRAYDAYDHYTNDLHKNTYIHDKWQRVMNQRKDNDK